jgi:hypothetical protein
MAWRILPQNLLRRTLNHDQARPGLMRAMGHPRLCIMGCKEYSLWPRSQLGLILIEKMMNVLKITDKKVTDHPYCKIQTASVIFCILQ